MNLTHLGGQNTVTGSCHLLQCNGVNILVDCGLAQGRDTVGPMAGWPVAKGTLGRDLVQYGRRPGGYVYIDGERHDIHARIHALTGYSAHADQ